jgi:hypothetical protein
MATWCHCPSLIRFELYTPPESPTYSPMRPLASIDPQLMSLAPPACSAPVIAGEVACELLPACVV